MYQDLHVEDEESQSPLNTSTGCLSMPKFGLPLQEESSGRETRKCTELEVPVLDIFFKVCSTHNSIWPLLLTQSRFLPSSDSSSFSRVCCINSKAKMQQLAIDANRVRANSGE